MGRKAKDPSTTAATNAAVNETEKKVEIKDNDEIVIVNKILAGNKTVVNNVVYVFDENGKCKMNGIAAKYFLSINGFEVESKKEEKTDVEEKAAADEEPATENTDTEVKE